MTQTQVNNILGDLYTARKLKIGGTATLIGVSVIIIIVGICMMVKAKKIVREEELGLSDSKYEKLNSVSTNKEHNQIQN